jgi:NADPH2:quinone reductase
MLAQVIYKTGGPEVFEIINMPIPELSRGHVLIKVAATSVNQIDCKIRSGVVAGIGPDFPAILQGDVAGVVEAVGPEVSEFKVGDEVYGCAGGFHGLGGALAEYMAADVRLLAKKPKTLSMTESAALPLVGITAWEALFDKAVLTKGQKVLVHGGIGGVGHIAVQLAKWAKAQVSTSVLSEKDFDLARALGADEVIDVSQESPLQYVQRLTLGEGFEVVIDTVGGKNLDRSLDAAAINGKIVTTAARSTHDLTPMHNKSLTLSAVFMLLPLITNRGREHHGQILKQLAEIADQGWIKPLIDPKHFSLESTAEAHTWLESGQARGKVVVNIVQ